jgi:hypothetical protein
MMMWWNMQRSQLSQVKLNVRLTYKYKGYHNPSNFAFWLKLIGSSFTSCSQRYKMKSCQLSSMETREWEGSL